MAQQKEGGEFSSPSPAPEAPNLPYENAVRIHRAEEAIVSDLKRAAENEDIVAFSVRRRELFGTLVATPMSEHAA